jgi:hypothetical protein
MVLTMHRFAREGWVMPDRTQPPYDDKAAERRSPVTDDLDPVGMDPEHETDELEAGGDEEFVDDDDSDDDVESDGVEEDPAAR